MENNDVSHLGPRPTRPARVATLSKARRTVLEALYDEGALTPLARLVAVTGLHENTLRGHLEGLESDGLATRQRDSPSGRGRPRWLWQVRATAADEYAGLAATLARTLRRTSPRPTEDAIEAGRSWGAELAASRPSRRIKPATSTVGRARDLLESLGFAPVGRVDSVADKAELRLTCCPLLEAAKEEPDIVCSVHLGLAIGALSHYGAPDPDAHLRPFAEPGACLLSMKGGAR